MPPATEYQRPLGEITDDERVALSDELLAVRCQLGEAAAFDALIARWHPPLWKYIRRLSGSDTEAGDTMQDVWLRVLRAFPQLREPARMRAWLFGIARRAVMDRLRQQYAEPASDDIDIDELAAPHDAHGLAEDIECMGEELARMPLIERDVLVLFYLQELTLTQVAEVLAVPVGTVKSRLFRARQMLRDRLTEQGLPS